MRGMTGLDWQSMFIPDLPVAEMILRGTVVYLALFVMLRIIRKRQASQVGVTDLLVLVLIADAAQNAMASEYRSITDGLILVATIILWSYILDWLGFLLPSVGRFVHPPPLLLIDKGKMMIRNMRREQITKEELLSQLREQGVDNVADVKAAYMEGDGQVSIIPYQKRSES
ncbi:MAG: hypothetical protein A4E57_00481 [Syntrophorhabdaceae bacterium PtaU1.Bin034]|nr:MAG: hypothetical protein A4E57_00481 [Syntrophorhabdaceae bacterium PtaU1.Bin034]